MSWYMPSYGRPERLRTMLDAPGGWPDTVWVLVNEDDPELERYQQVRDQIAHEGRPLAWVLQFIPAGSRCADAHRWISENHPDEPFYGLLCDDHWPITPGWHEKLVEAAGPDAISTPTGEPSFPKLRNALVIGGDVARAMGSLVPIPVKHNYEDNVWDQIAEDFNILVPCPDLIVEHRHHIHGTAKVDKTYERGSHDIDADRLIFEAWLRNPEKREMYLRIAEAVGKNIKKFDADGVHLVILTPMQESAVDAVYHASLNDTLFYLQERHITLSVRQTTGGSHIGKARERMLWDVWYDIPDATHFLMIDADMGWNPETVVKLLASDHEFAAVIGRFKRDELKFAGNFFPGPARFHPETNFIQVADVGGAFVMLKRAVIQKMIDAYPELEYDAAPGRREWALWLDMIEHNQDQTAVKIVKGQRLSEDLSFCRRWRAIGGEIWVDATAEITHVGRKEYKGKLKDLFRYGQKQAPAAEAAA